MSPRLLKLSLSYLAYLLAGIGGVGSAFYLSTHFLKAAYSQSPTTPSPSSPSEAEEAPSAQGPSEPTNGQQSPTPSSSFVEEVQSYLEPFIYDPRGRRDPFSPYVEMQGPAMSGDQSVLLPLQRFDLEQLNLIGIIWNVTDPKAMFVDPNNQVHIVGRDERIGRKSGYIAVIREGEVVVVEAAQRKGDLVYTSRVLTLEQ